MARWEISAVQKRYKEVELHSGLLDILRNALWLADADGNISVKYQVHSDRTLCRSPLSLNNLPDQLRSECQSETMLDALLRRKHHLCRNVQEAVAQLRDGASPAPVATPWIPEGRV